MVSQKSIFCRATDTGTDGQTFHFTSQVTFGFNIYLTLEGTKFNLKHRVVVALIAEQSTMCFSRGLRRWRKYPIQNQMKEVECSVNIELYRGHASCRIMSGIQTLRQTC